MLQISNAKPAVSGAGYYLNYYLRDTNGHAHWYGKGAFCLGLQGQIVQDEFRNVLQGFNYDRKYPLVKNAGEPDRVGFWDFTFSVPKSLSVMYATASKDVREAIDREIHKALTTTLDYAENMYGLSRRGPGGREWVPAKLAFALFRHINSREDQPQIHWHCLLINLGVRKDGTIATLQTKPLFEAKLSLGALFRCELAKGLTEDLGLKIDHSENGFHIQGVPKDLCASNSKRREQIQEYMKERGLNGALAAKEAAVKTRAPKTHHTQEELFKKWKTSADRAGWNAAKVDELLGATFLKTRRTQPIESPRLSELKGGQLSETGIRHDECGFAISIKDHAKRMALKESLQVIPGARVASSCLNPFQKSQEELRFAGDPIKIPPPEPKVLNAFKTELREATDRIFPEKQTRKNIEKLGFAIGRKHNLGARAILSAVDELKLPIHRTLYRVEWKPVFPHAPKWSPVHDLRTPRIVLRDRPKKWNKIYYSKPLPAIGGAKVEFRIQQRLLFPKAPKWNPASKLSLPALHFGQFRPYAEEAKKREQEKNELHRIMREEEKITKRL